MGAEPTYIYNLNYIDDVLIVGKIKKSMMALVKVMDRAKLLNIKFNPNKIQYQKSQIKYLGFNFSKKDVELDEYRVEAIAKLKSSINIKELESKPMDD